ncbi:hypothetical protein A2856_02530 [Candidatus Uhrbacteria bacterium RIFCSPHIGHO2_01_FULL_63_20]|uniref:PIN domain-containing protein n=1 Tax=Candidatus Uhrbacteria bacterium RIFCSPHIGHO2_01_FULL_63_20 TaxID=1802385 RepID=A0A1F7TKJ9_9BACT|nr:MAG: hypothetical protein A2856_02530 [Candidatus Uhrbacteria bacterium RIFCSPHIGHO2_01_FULL_63_20]
MTVFDSNVWIAFLNIEDSQHAKAKKAFAEASLPIVLPEYVVLEASTVLAKRASKEIADTFLDRVGSNRDVKILLTDQDFFGQCVAAYRARTGRALSFADVALLVLSAGFEVVTFDAALRAAIRKGNPT